MRGERDPAGGLIRIVLEVRDGFHVNANPASVDGLVATAVGFDGPQPSRVDFPRPGRFRPGFLDVVLDVYEGEVVLTAHFDGDALDGGDDLSAALTTQACNDRVCLPPAIIPVPLSSTLR